MHIIRSDQFSEEDVLEHSLVNNKFKEVVDAGPSAVIKLEQKVAERRMIVEMLEDLMDKSGQGVQEGETGTAGDEEVGVEREMASPGHRAGEGDGYPDGYGTRAHGGDHGEGHGH